MTIDKAIEILEISKSAGNKNIVFAFWESDMFDMHDDDAWAHYAERLEDTMDWSSAHGMMLEYVRHFADEYGKSSA